VNSVNDAAGAKPKSTIEILQQSAQQILKEDEAEFQQAFAKEVKNLTAVVEEQREIADIHSFVKEVAKAENDDYEDDEYERDDDVDKVKPKLNVKTVVQPESESDDDGEVDDHHDSGDDRLEDPEERRRGFELLLACHKGDGRQVATLLKKGVSLYYKDRHGWYDPSV
jgi:hypothetical protein